MDKRFLFIALCLLLSAGVTSSVYAVETACDGDREELLLDAPPLPKPPNVLVKTITFLAGTLFDFDKSVLKPGGKEQLSKLVDKLKANTLIERIHVVGHTDNVGSDAYNDKLSQRRAKAVVDYLTKQGMKKGLMTVEGRGEKEPVATNETDEGRQKNRRVELKIYTKRRETKKASEGE